MRVGTNLLSGLPRLGVELLNVGPVQKSKSARERGRSGSRADGLVEQRGLGVQGIVRVGELEQLLQLHQNLNRKHLLQSSLYAE